MPNTPGGVSFLCPLLGVVAAQPSGHAHTEYISNS